MVGRWTVGLRGKLVSREVHRDGSFGVGGKGGGLSRRGKVGCRGRCLFGCVGESCLDRSEFLVQNSGDAVVHGAAAFEDVAFGFDGVVAKVVEGVQLLILSTNRFARGNAVVFRFQFFANGVGQVVMERDNDIDIPGVGVGRKEPDKLVKLDEQLRDGAGGL